MSFEEDTGKFSGGSPPFPGISSVFRELNLLVRTFLPQALSSYFQLVDETLFDRADSARDMQEQRIFFDAMRLLRSCHESLNRTVSERYYQSFDALQSNDLSLMLSAESLRNEGLSLMDNQVLEEMIALDNIVTSIVVACGEDLAFLTKRLEYIIGQPLREEENPFVPETLAEIFAQEVSALQLDIEAKLLIFKLFEKHFAARWPALIANSNDLLKSRGIREGLEQQKKEIVKKDLDDKIAQSSESETKAERSSAPATPLDRSISDSQLVDDLYRLLGQTFSLAPTPANPESKKASITQSELIELLTVSAKDVGQYGEHSRGHGLESAIAALLSSRNTSLEQLHPRERVVISVLDKSFTKLDSQQLAPHDLPNLISSMEIPITNMVLRDPQFLEKPNHPGRRLVNEIFNACSTFLDGAEKDSDPLRKEVDNLIGQLTQLELSPRDLTRMLSEFIEFVEKDRRKQATRELRLLEEEEAAARVSVAHSLVYDHLSPLLIGRVLPRFILNFCEDAWSKVLFFLALREGDGAENWQQRMAEASLIIDWGRQPGESEDDLANLLETIRAQLETISLDPAAQERWLQLFADYWQRSLAGQWTGSHASFEKIEVQDVILRLPGVRLVESEKDENVDLRALESLDSLKKGIWVEFKATENSNSVRCKLAGIVESTSQYIFTNRKGAKVTEEPRHQLASKLKTGNVVVLDNHRLFDRAFQDAVKDLKSTGSRANLRDDNDSREGHDR